MTRSKTQKSKKTVVTVDDEPSIRLLIRAALQEDANISVIEASDGQAGLDVIRKHHPDLVILDVVMPRLDGVDTLLALRADPAIAETPVIMLTAVKEHAKLQLLLDQRSTDFLAKPFLLELLRSKVKDILYPQAS